MEIAVYIEEVSRGEAGPIYEATLESGKVVARSRTPLFAAARVLQAEGFPDDATLLLRRKGSKRTDMTGTIGQLSKLTIIEGKAPPRIGRFTAYER